jgi:hypothetical protein
VKKGGKKEGRETGRRSLEGLIGSEEIKEE